jgi:hypothetical protein
MKLSDYHSARGLLFNPPWYPHPPSGFVPPACYVPPCYGRLGLHAPFDAIAFVHNRTTPAGVTRLISVGVMIGAIAPNHEPFFDGTTYELDSASAPARDHNFSSIDNSINKLDSHFFVTGGAHLRVFAGQVDPADASHFSLRYAIDDREGTIDGWLRDRLDKKADIWGRDKTEWVEFSVRDGPAASGNWNREIDHKIWFINDLTWYDDLGNAMTSGITFTPLKSGTVPVAVVVKWWDRDGVMVQRTERDITTTIIANW